MSLSQIPKELIGVIIPLTRDSPRYEASLPFKNGISLLPNQKAILYEALRLEENCTKYYEPSPIFGDIILNSNSIVLSDKPGCGKTKIIEAIILARLHPKVEPTLINNLSSRLAGGVSPKIQLSHQIRRHYVTPGAVIRPNLIFVGASVVGQFYDTIRYDTDLRIFMIDNVYSLREFYSLFKRNLIDESYDVVIVKNGEVTGNFLIEDEPRPTSVEIPTRPISVVIALISYGRVWPRVFYDDLDVIALPSAAPNIPALRTYYVSSTSVKPSGQPSYGRKFDTLSAAIEGSFFKQNQIFHDTLLFSAFNLRCQDQFTDDSMNVTFMDMFCYELVAHAEKFIGLLNAMSQKETEDIIEMMNSDAFETAANRLGIAANSAADIYSRVVNSCKSACLTAQKRLAFGEHYWQTIAALPEPIEPIEPRLIARFDANLQRHRKIPNEDIGFSFEELMAICRRYIDTKKNELRAANAPLDRMINNVKDMTCSACKSRLDSPDIYGRVVLLCCGVAICDVCASTLLNFKGIYSNAGAQMPCAPCPNCKTLVKFGDLFYIDSQVDVDKLSEDMANLQATDTDEIQKKAEEEVAAAAALTAKQQEEARKAAEDEEFKKNVKFTTMIRLIKGEDVASTCITADVERLTPGVVNRPLPKNVARKWVIFTNYGETIDKVYRALAAAGIKALILGGTSSEISKCVALFKAEDYVLLINTSHSCAGLNLEFATDGIVFHVPSEAGVLAQLLARLQRIGRTYNARFHMLCYKTEFGEFRTKYNIKPSRPY